MLKVEPYRSFVWLKGLDVPIVQCLVKGNVGGRYSRTKDHLLTETFPTSGIVNIVAMPLDKPFGLKATKRNLICIRTSCCFSSSGLVRMASVAFDKKCCVSGALGSPRAILGAYTAPKEVVPHIMVGGLRTFVTTDIGIAIIFHLLK